MNPIISKSAAWAACGLFLALSVQAGEPVYPVKVSANGRYFVDQKDNPVFWMGTTQWELFRRYTVEEARTILEKSKDKGFAFVQVMLMGVGDGTKPNIHGDKPWNNNNPLTPNEGYFKNVDEVVRIACEKNVNISMTVFHQRYRKWITLQNARAWTRWIAHRYKDVPTIVWSMTPEARPEFVPILRKLAAGLREGDGGRHLITFKPDPAPYTSSFIHEEKWLDFNSMQTWKSVELIYPMVTRDYNLKPVKPVLMAEGAYEHGSEYGFDVTPLWIRRQAYYSYLLGGHHTYGHNDSWRVLPTWKQALDAPGATQTGFIEEDFSGPAGVVAPGARSEHLGPGRQNQGSGAPPGGSASRRQMDHGVPGRQGDLRRPHGQNHHPTHRQSFLGQSQDRRRRGHWPIGPYGRKIIYNSGKVGGCSSHPRSLSLKEKNQVGQLSWRLLTCLFLPRGVPVFTPKGLHPTAQGRAAHPGKARAPHPEP